MKAAILYGQKDIRYEEIETPKIDNTEILVRVKATGICGSDIPRVLGTGAHYYPIILGHEFSGEVVEVGEHVTRFKPGDRVAGVPLVPCYLCGDCQQGHYAQCKNYSFIGSRISGSWAEYVKLPAMNGVKLPETVTYEEGALFEPVTVALHGLLMMNFLPGTDVAVVGAGTIGMCTIQCARNFGVKRIFVFDINPARLELARKYGADICLNTGDDSFQQIVDMETNNRGFDAVIETAGVEFTEKLSLRIAANKGQIMFIGTPSKTISLSPRDFENINRKELYVRGSWMSYSAPFPGREWDLAGYYFEQGKIQCEELIHRVYPLEQIGLAFEELSIPGRVSGKILLKG